MHLGSQALLAGIGNLLIIGSTDWNTNLPQSYYAFNVVFTQALWLKTAAMISIIFLYLI